MMLQPTRELFPLLSLCAVVFALTGCPDNGAGTDAAPPRNDAGAMTDAPTAMTDAPMAMTDAPVAMTDAPMATTDAPMAAATWADVHTQLQMRCALCHGGGTPATGGHNMGQADVMAAYNDSQLPAGACAGITKGACAAMRVRAGSMPPGGLAEPARSELASLLDRWVEAGQPAP
jgi:uncharacterized membrane protein